MDRDAGGDGNDLGGLPSVKDADSAAVTLGGLTMARTSEPNAGLQAIGRRILELIEDEIARLEGLLAELQTEAQKWMRALTGSGPQRGARTRERQVGRPGRPSGAKRRPAGKRARPRTGRVAKVTTAGRRLSPAVDWDAVLGKLPEKFAMDDIAKVTPELEQAPQARVIALARWARAKKIKKTGKGKYRRLAA